MYLDAMCLRRFVLVNLFLLNYLQWYIDDDFDLKYYLLGAAEPTLQFPSRLLLGS